MNEELTLNRLPADLSYLITRGFQTHDFLHILTGYQASGGLLRRFPYHAYGGWRRILHFVNCRWLFQATSTSKMGINLPPLMAV